MKVLSLLFTALLAMSCNDKAVDNDVVGAWQHVESLSDIGNGNATFHRVNSEKTLLFTAYGTVISNQNVCTGNNFKEGTVATWNPEKKEFNVDDCVASYELDKELGTLTVHYRCMEACAEKYVRPE